MFAVNDLLDLAKLKPRQIIHLADQLDLPVVVREAVAPYAKDAQRKGIEFQVNTLGSPYVVLGDPKRISSVVSNLAANAG